MTTDLTALRDRVAGLSGGIYIASKTKHADRWRIARNVLGYPIVSTWINEAGEGETSDFADLWNRCLSEAAGADVLILYHHSDNDVLKGAFIELGAALSHGRKVIVVGNPPGTWPAHPNVERAESMEAALKRAAAIVTEAGEAG